jgi:hypothetical protein
VTIRADNLVLLRESELKDARKRKRSSKRHCIGPAASRSSKNRVKSLKLSSFKIKVEPFYKELIVERAQRDSAEKRSEMRPSQLNQKNSISVTMR